MTSECEHCRRCLTFPSLYCRALVLAHQLRTENKADDKTVTAAKLALVRRGSALCWSGKLGKGLRDYREAEKLQEAEIARCTVEADAAKLKADLAQIVEDISRVTRAQGGAADTPGPEDMD